MGPAQYVPLLLSLHFQLLQATLGPAIICSYFIPTFLQERQDSPLRHWALLQRGSLWLLPVFLHTLRGTELWARAQWEMSEGCSRRAGEAECRMLHDKTRGWNLVWTHTQSVLQRWSDTYTWPTASLGDQCLIQEWVNFPQFVMSNGMASKFILL